MSDSATPWTAARQASLSITNSRSSPKPMFIKLVMPSNHLILCHPLQSFPATGSLQTSQFFASGGQSIGVSASASLLPMDPAKSCMYEWRTGDPPPSERGCWNSTGLFPGCEDPGETLTRLSFPSCRAFLDPSSTGSTKTGTLEPERCPSTGGRQNSAETLLLSKASVVPCEAWMFLCWHDWISN